MLQKIKPIRIDGGFGGIKGVIHLMESIINERPDKPKIIFTEAIYDDFLDSNGNPTPETFQQVLANTFTNQETKKHIKKLIVTDAIPTEQLIDSNSNPTEKAKSLIDLKQQYRKLMTLEHDTLTVLSELAKKMDPGSLKEKIPENSESFNKKRSSHL
jgi:hypothetical protein